MKFVDLALGASFEFATKCGIIVIAVALLVAMTSDDGDPAPSNFGEPAASASGDKALQVTMEADEGRRDARCALLDQDGNHLLLASYDRHGVLWLQWRMGDFPIQPGCTSSRDGRLNFFLSDGAAQYMVERHRDGGAGVTMINAESGEREAVGRATDGGRIADPNQIGCGLAAPGSPEDQNAAGGTDQAASPRFISNSTPSGSRMSKMESP